MTVQKSNSKSTGILECTKCGSSMIERMLALKVSEKITLVKILQCKVCKHWKRLE